MKVFLYLDSIPKGVLLLLGIISVGLIAYFQWLCGYEISFFIFYALPIGVVVWFSSRVSGIFIAFMSAIAWFVSDVEAGHHYSSRWIGCWDASVRGVFFIFVALACPAIRQQLEKNRREADLLRGVLAICNSCRRLRDQSECWSPIETYIRQHSNAEVKQTLCPDCARKAHSEGF